MSTVDAQPSSHPPAKREITATDLAYYELAVFSTSKAAPSWAAFSRWLSAGAGAVVAAALSNLVALDVSSSYVSVGGVAMALASLLPALGGEWRYLFLQPVWDAHEYGEEVAKKYEDGPLDHQALGRLVVEQAPLLVRRMLRKVLVPIDPIAAGGLFFRMGREGRRLVIEQMAMLVASVTMLASPKIVQRLDAADSLDRAVGSWLR